MKINKIIALCGYADSGKTTTLKKLAKLLLTKGAVMGDKRGLWIFKGASSKRNHAGKAALDSKKGDVIIVIEINGRIIVIITCGDKDDVAAHVKEVLEGILGNETFDMIVAIRKSDGKPKKLKQNYNRIFGVQPICLFKPKLRYWEQIDAQDKDALDNYWVGRLCDLVGI